MHKIEAQNVFHNACVVSVLLNNLNFALFKYNYNSSCSNKNRFNKLYLSGSKERK